MTVRCGGQEPDRRFADLVEALAWIRSTEGFAAVVVRDSDGEVVARRPWKGGQREEEEGQDE